MKQIQVRTSEVARYTAKYIVNNGTDIATATAKGIAIAGASSTTFGLQGLERTLSINDNQNENAKWITLSFVHIARRNWP